MNGNLPNSETFAIVNLGSQPCAYGMDCKAIVNEQNSIERRSSND